MVGKGRCRQALARRLHYSAHARQLGIGGIVAFLPRERSVVHPTFDPDDRSKVHEFYIQRIRFDGDGKPDMVLSLHPIDVHALSPDATSAELQNRTTDHATQESRLKSLLAEVISSVESREEPAHMKKKRPIQRNKRIQRKTSSADAAFVDSLSDFLDAFSKDLESKKKDQ